MELDNAGNLQIDGDLTVSGNTIKASDGGSTITLDTSDNVTIGNDITIGGNVIRASDGGSTITMDTSDNVTIAGGLTIDGGSLTVNGTTPTLTLGDGGDEDIKLLFNSNTNDYYIGSDATDDSLCIGVGSTIGAAGNSAIRINSGSFVEFPKGLRYSPSVFVGPTETEVTTQNKWMKVAEHKVGLSETSYSSAMGIFLVTMTGLGHTSYDIFKTWLITVQWGEMNNSLVTGPPGTKISAQLLDSSESDDQGSMDPEDIVLTVNGCLLYTSPSPRDRG